MIWLIGSGSMAQSYIKVLLDKKIEFKVIGRGEESATQIFNAFGIQPVTGGLSKFIHASPEKCSHAIVAVGVEELFNVSKSLIKYGIKNILIEKPAALTLSQLKLLQSLAKAKKSSVVIGYNRRFYDSVLEAKKIIQEDGGVLSFNFEFTEWTHLLSPATKSKNVLKNWLLANSTHVIDLAFYLGGTPKKMQSFIGGKKKIKWHPESSIFTGAGVTKTGSLFSYSANWISAGRWSVEVMTQKHRLIFKPLEQLQIQKIGSVEILPVKPTNAYDQDFKPGLYSQVTAFLEGEIKEFCTLKEQASHFIYYKDILNGKTTK